MGLFDLFRRKKRPSESERREFLLKRGRITEGTIIETETTADGDEVAYYFYSINGVDFESSDVLTEQQRAEPVKYAPGAKVNIRFDPKSQGNSILE